MKNIIIIKYLAQHFLLTNCIEALVAMGYNRQEIEASLAQVRYDDVFATYLLLGRKSTDVSVRRLAFLICEIPWNDIYFVCFMSACLPAVLRLA